MNRRAWLLFFLLTSAVGVFLSALEMAIPWCWLANALFAASLVCIYQLGHIAWQEAAAEGGLKLARKYAPLAADTVCLLIVVSACTFMYWRAALGDRPTSGDHNLRFFRFWYFMTHMVPERKLFGWSNMWFGGEPVGYLYPFGCSIWAAIVYWCGLGRLSLDQAYAVAVWLAYVFEGVALFFTGRYIFGRSAGLIGAVLAVTDIGAYTNMGGWYMTVKTGVWPNTLSIAFGLLALVAFLHLLDKGKWSTVGWFSLAAGIAVLMHPLQMINLPVMLGTCVLAHLIRGEWRVCWDARGRIMVGVALTLMIAALFVLPLISSREFAMSSNRIWARLGEMGKSLYEGNLFSGMWSFTAVLGFLGAILALSSRVPSRMMLGLLFFIYMLLGSNEFGGYVADLFSTESKRKVEFLRFSTLLRPFWAMAAGWVVYLILERFGRPRSRVACIGKASESSDANDPVGERLLCGSRFEMMKAFFQVFVAASVSFPLLLPFLSSWFRERRELTHAYYSTREHEHRTAMVQWLKDRAAETPEFLRIALFDRKHMHTYFDLAVELELPVHNLGWSPATAYRYQISQYDAKVLEALSVRYVLAPSLQESVLLQVYDELNSRLLPVTKFGDIYVNEFANYRPERFTIIEGTGGVKMHKFEDEEIVFEVEPKSEGTLMLGLSYFDRWQATRDGVPVKINTTQVGTENSAAMVTVSLRPGLYRLQFVRRWPEKVGSMCAVLGLLSALMLTLVGRQHSPLDG